MKPHPSHRFAIKIIAIELNPDLDIDYFYDYSTYNDDSDEYLLEGFIFDVFYKKLTITDIEQKKILVLLFSHSLAFTYVIF